MKKIKNLFGVLKASFNGFMDDKAFKLAASLSYYTVFSLGPVLLIIISLAGIFYGREAVQGRIYGQINGLVGSEAAVQVQEIVANVQQEGTSTIGAIVGIIMLVVGATAVFIEMQDSINMIWSVKAKPKKGWLAFLRNRLLSFSMIISIGFILLVSLIVSAFLDVLSDRLMRLFADYTVYLFYILNTAVIFLVIAGLFTVIFKVLPDAHIRTKDAFIGAAFTSVLFLIGKFAIGAYIGNSDLGATYGAAASIVIILTWVYYSSLILFFGAEFTKAYAITTGGGITPSKTAVFVMQREAKEIDTTPPEKPADKKN